MSNWKYGYNVDLGSVSLEKFLVDAINSGSNIHTIMCTPSNGIPTKGDLDTLWLIYNTLVTHYPNLKLIWRFYSNREGNWRQYPDSKIYVDVLKSLKDKYGLPPNTIIDSLANEPSLNGNSFQTNEEYVRHESQILHDLRDIGIDYAVGAFSVGTPHENQIMRGVYDQLLKDAKYISMHLYGIFPFEAEFNYELMLPTEENRQFIRDIYLNGRKFPEWLQEALGFLFNRHKWFELRCNQLNINMPKVVITEGFVDLIDNVPEYIRRAWSDKHGIDIYFRDPRGILSWFNAFNWYFPELTVNEIIQMIMIHIRENILNESYIIGMTLFGYNRNWGYPNGSHRFSGHNWEDEILDSFRKNNMRIVNNMTVLDSGSNNEYGLLWSTVNSNIRIEPRIAAETLIKTDNGNLLLTGEKITVIMLDTDVEGIGNSYRWYKFIHPDGSVYYIAKTGNVQYLEQPRDDNSEDKYVVDFLRSTLVLTATEMQEIIEAEKKIQDIFYELKEERDNLNDPDDYIKDQLGNLLELFEELDDVNLDKMLSLQQFLIDELEKAKKF